MTTIDDPHAEAPRPARFGVRNGRAAELSVIRVGDPVFAHVYPSSSGAMLVERLFAGSSADAGGPDCLGPPPAAPTAPAAA